MTTPRPPVILRREDAERVREALLACFCPAGSSADEISADCSEGVNILKAALAAEQGYERQDSRTLIIGQRRVQWRSGVIQTMYRSSAIAGVYSTREVLTDMNEARAVALAILALTDRGGG